MKIEKLYTLSQFVDIIKESVATLKLNSTYELIFKYNDFLKQPLTKEMFVNEIEKPIRKYGIKKGQMYNPKFIAWDDAENKVIFTKYHNIIDLDFILDYECKENRTLHLLAELTKGLLKLKNVAL